MKKHLGYARIGKVIIGNKVFIGAGTIIFPNVSIGDNSIIGAGSVATRYIPANVVAAGNPAKILCTLYYYLSKHDDFMKSKPLFGEEYTYQEIYQELKEYFLWQFPTITLTIK